jgi:hypothetical protein
MVVARCWRPGQRTPALPRTWIMNCGMMRWKVEPLKCSGLPDWPVPFSPVHRALKFSTVLGTVFPNKPITILPARRNSREPLC